jgi:O-acetyl-ADP-ribose deacetylase (regulator of RNase III)
MITETIKGDLLQLFKEGKFSAIAHGANCYCTMGAGIARQIAEQFPGALESDIRFEKQGDWKKLGAFSYESTKYGNIYNLYTQFLPGSNFEYSALIYALSELEFMIELSTGLDNFVLGVPLIGCGIGGGNEEIVKEILDFSSLNIILVEYDNGKTNMGQTEIDFTS